MREFATGHFVANQDNVLMLGSPGVGKTHLALALGRSMAKISNLVLGTTATALIGALAKAENSGQLKNR